MAVSSARSEADLDPFGAPIDVRTYADYKNVSNKPVVGVKFRIRYADAEGKDRGTFHAPHACSIGPGMTASEKWKKDKVDPRITTMMIRVLAVKFADGSLWESSKLGNVIKPPGAGETNSGGGGAQPPEASDSAPAAQPTQTLQSDSPEGGGADPFGGGAQ